MLTLPFKILFSPYLLPMTLLVGGFLWFRTSVPNACPPLSFNADMFVLTGDPRRIPFALERLGGFPSRRLYIVGVGAPTLDVAHKDQIYFESQSRSTYENAIAIRHIVRRDHLNTIVLITTEDHMRRSLYKVRQQLPDTEIIPCPVPLSNMASSRQLERWVEEYIKFIGALLGLTSRRG